MKQYRATALQNSLLQLPFDTSTLSLLQTQPVSRIQIVSTRGIKALKSIDDIHRKIRIVLASVFIKILLQYSQRNQERLETLKKILYDAKLQQITQKKGIVRQHLLKSVAQKLSHPPVGPNAQVEVLKMFNLSPFFDEIVLDSLKEENPLIFESDCQLVVWLDRELDYKIQVTEDNLQQENQSELFLVGIGERFHPAKDCKCMECGCKQYRQFLRYSTQTTAESKDQPMQSIQDRRTHGEMFSRLIFQEQQIQNCPKEVNQNLYASVLSSSMDLGASQTNNVHLLATPPTLKDIKRIEFEDSVNSATFSKNKKMKPGKTDNEMETETQKTEKVIKLKRSKANDQESGIWNLFCCKF